MCGLQFFLGKEEIHTGRQAEPIRKAKRGGLLSKREGIMSRPEKGVGYGWLHTLSDSLRINWRVRFWLHASPGRTWVSSVAASGVLSTAGRGLRMGWLPLFGACALECRLRSGSSWDLPGPGMAPGSAAWAGGFLTPGAAREAPVGLFCVRLLSVFCN